MFYSHIITSSHHRTCHKCYNPQILFPLLKSTSGMSVTMYNLYLQCLLIKSTSIKRYTTLELYFLLSNHHVTSVTSLIFCHFNIFTSGTSVTTFIFCVFSSYQPVLQPSFSTSPNQINKFYECYK